MKANELFENLTYDQLKALLLKELKAEGMRDTLLSDLMDRSDALVMPWIDPGKQEDGYSSTPAALMERARASLEILEDCGRKSGEKAREVGQKKYAYDKARQELSEQQQKLKQASLMKRYWFALARWGMSMDDRRAASDDA